jgi:hypothetical protein
LLEALGYDRFKLVDQPSLSLLSIDQRFWPLASRCRASSR